MDNPAITPVVEEVEVVEPVQAIMGKRKPGNPEIMDFPNAIRKVINGEKIRRISWPEPKDYALLKEDFLVIFTKGDFFKWTINDGDLLGKDWVITFTPELNGQN